MINSKPSFLKSWNLNYKAFAIAIAILALIGFGDATFLTVENILGAKVPCSIIEGCEQVLTSKYANFYGIPIALFGSVYYLIIFLFSYISITRSDKKYLLLASSLTPLGFIVSIFLVFLQLVVIKAICIYCMLSALVSSLLFILGMISIKLSHRLDEMDLISNEMV